MDRRAQDGALLQLVNTHHEQAAEAHKRNRERVESATGRIASLEAGHTDLRERLSALERTPVSADKVIFSGRLLVTAISVTLIMSGWMWALQNGIRDLHTDVNGAVAAIAAASKLQDERNTTQKETMDNLGRQIEMRRVEIQRLSDKLTEFMQSKGK